MITNTQILLAVTMSLILVVSITPAFAQVDGNTAPTSTIANPAVAITPSATWYEFSHNEPLNTPVTGCLPDDPAASFGCVPSSGGNSVILGPAPWTFSCGSGGCWVTLTDAFIPTEDFELFDGAVSQGTTSTPGGPGAGSPSDPANTSTDGAWSTGMFFLGPGAHSITIHQTAGFGGAAYFQLTQHEAVGGEFLPIDSTALILAGAQTNAVWIMSALAVIGSIAFGALYITSKKN